jgi:hypothetical protein
MYRRRFPSASAREIVTLPKMSAKGLVSGGRKLEIG